MNNPYYKLAENLKGKTKILWGLLALLILSSFILIVNSNLSQSTQQELTLNILSSFILLSAMVVFFVIPCIKTFHSLQGERGIFKNHKRQEVFYTLVYTIIFSTITLAFIMVTYESIYF